MKQTKTLTILASFGYGTILVPVHRNCVQFKFKLREMNIMNTLIPVRVRVSNKI